MEMGLKIVLMCLTVNVIVAAGMYSACPSGGVLNNSCDSSFAADDDQLYSPIYNFGNSTASAEASGMVDIGDDSGIWNTNLINVALSSFGAMANFIGVIYGVMTGPVFILGLIFAPGPVPAILAAIVTVPYILILIWSLMQFVFGRKM